MSEDFEVFSCQKPEKESIIEFVRQNSGWSTNDDVSWLYHADGCSVNIDGPFKVFEDDLPECVSSLVLAEWNFQFHINLETSEDQGKMRAEALCSHLARQFKGVVYDPQLGSVIWPLKKSARKPTTRIELVELCFYLPVNQSNGELPKKFLETLRAHCPECIPTRFGAFEPFQGKMEGNDEQFINEWQAEAVDKFGSAFWWQANPPCFGGSIIFSHQSPHLCGNMPERFMQRNRLSLEFNGDTLREIGALRVVNLFRELCKNLNAFYAAALVSKNAILKKNSIAFDGESEVVYLQRSKWWIGLPRKPVWLTWFGSPYYPLLQPVLKDCGFAHIESDTIFVQMSDQPTHQDQLYGLYPQLPSRLMQTGEDIDPICAKEIPEF